MILKTGSKLATSLTSWGRRRCSDTRPWVNYSRITIYPSAEVFWCNNRWVLKRRTGSDGIPHTLWRRY